MFALRVSLGLRLRWDWFGLFPVSLTSLDMRQVLQDVRDLARSLLSVESFWYCFPVRGTWILTGLDIGRILWLVCRICGSLNCRVATLDWMENNGVTITISFFF